MSDSNSVFFIKIALQAVTLGSGFYAIYYLMNKLDPQSKERKRAEKSKHVLLERLKSKTGADGPALETDEYEDLICSEVVDPDSIEVGFDDIGGLEEVKRGLYEAVILPFSRKDLFANSSLLTPPKGLLLYGPPGTGKTMLAKAVAKETSANFMNVKISSLQDKFFGESQKRVKAVFTLAEKLSPCVIFIDEIDVFLRERHSSDDSHLSNMKSEFMTMWDGLQSSAANDVIVIAATNRPFDVDAAILRRLPRAFLVDLPQEQQRLEILRVLLRQKKSHVKQAKDEGSKDNNSHDEYIVSEDCSIESVAKATKGYSGSDLKELCKYASLLPVREFIEAEKNGKVQPGQIPRRINQSDFVEALQYIKPTCRTASEYRKFMAMRAAEENNPFHIPSSSSSSSAAAAAAAAASARNNDLAHVDVD